MMKPGIGAYDRFKAMFDKAAKEAGKELYLIPYFIAAHPGTTDEDMMNLALWLKKNRYRADQVQTFLPSPMSLSAAMYHSERNPLRPVRRVGSETVFSARGLKQRRLHKAFLRYHDPENWPVLRDALKRMGRADLIGPGKQHLVPSWQPPGTGWQRRRGGTARAQARGAALHDAADDAIAAAGVEARVGAELGPPMPLDASGSFPVQRRSRAGLPKDRAPAACAATARDRCRRTCRAGVPSRASR